ncbi:LysR family transcriptional regulator [Rhodobacteraceae bacterium NNCM2]|nr:LysR family transcriptional regulator [Coraliihabitans acroporae]
MNLTNLRTFLAIVETGSLVRASDLMNVTQSTVTTRLKTLEEEMGQSLLYRQKTGVQLTSAGIRFKRYAEAMTDLWRQARQEISLPEDVETVCRLGCHIDLWPSVGRRMFRAVHLNHPATAISVWQGNAGDLDAWINTGLSNAVLSYQPFNREGQSPHRLADEELVLVSDRAEAGMHPDPGYVYVDAGEEFGRRHAAAYAHAGRARTTFGSAVWALEHLLTLGGSAYLPRRLVGAELEAGRLHLVPGAPRFSRAVYLITRDSAAEGWPWLDEIIALIAR